jgi:hypothetical protein
MVRPTKHRPDSRFFGEAGTASDGDHDVYMGHGATEASHVGLRDGTRAGWQKGSGTNVKWNGRDDDSNYFSSPVNHSSHGEGRIVRNEVYGSFGSPSVRRSMDAETLHLNHGDPIESNEVSSGGSSRTVDRLRNESKYDRRTRSEITNPFHRSIASENSDYHK